jgi:AraC-like DNA-binding protein
MSGGSADFTWTRAHRGLFCFEARDFTGVSQAQALAWYGMSVVTSGSIVLRRGDSEWVASPGMIVLAAPHEIFTRSYPAGGCSFRGVFPTQRTLDAALSNAGPALMSFRSPVADNPMLASAILASVDSVRSGSLTQQESLFAAMIAQLLRSRLLVDDHRREEREHRAVRTVKSFIVAQQHDVVSMQTLASIAGISRFHLSRVFSATEGVSPYLFYEHVRMARARYLIHSGASLSDTAFALGFCDQSHLTRQFHAIMQMTPGAYARAVRAAKRDGLAATT